MSEKLRTPIIVLLIVATWIALFFLLFQLASENKSTVFLLICLAPILLFSAGAVFIAQNEKLILFCMSVVSLVMALLIIASPFTSFLRPIGNSAIAIVNKATVFATGKTPYELSHPAATAEEWVARAQNVKTGKKLNFLEFPKIAYWTQVCIFSGHSTDAQFASILPYPSKWKLSDKSKVTTHIDYYALAFADSSAKKIIHVYDIPKSALDFDPSLHQKCLDRSKSQLRRTKEGSAGTGPLFSK